jgi:hypothetical protein
MGQDHVSVEMDKWMYMEQPWNDIDRGKQKYWDKNLPQWNSLHHMVLIELERETPPSGLSLMTRVSISAISLQYTLITHQGKEFWQCTLLCNWRYFVFAPAWMQFVK